MDIEPEDLKDTSLEQMIWWHAKRSFSDSYGHPMSELLDEIPLNLDQCNRWIDSAENRLASANSLSKEAWAEHCEKLYENDMKVYGDLHEKLAHKRGLIATKMHEVEGWQPPTPDHEWLKQHMMCDLRIMLKRCASPELPEKPDWEDKRQKVIKSATWDFEFAHKQILERTEQHARETKWLKDLRSAIGNPPPTK